MEGVSRLSSRDEASTDGADAADRVIRVVSLNKLVALDKVVPEKGVGSKKSRLATPRAARSSSLLRRKRSVSSDDLSSSATIRLERTRIIPTKLPIPRWRSSLTKSSSIGSLAKARKTPPKVPAKPRKKSHTDVTHFGPGQARTLTVEAREFLQKSRTEIERLQGSLRTRINLSTAESYREKLPGFPAPLRVSAIADLDLNENITKSSNPPFDTELKIETDGGTVDDGWDFEKNGGPLSPRRPRYSEEVSEIEKRWSGEFFTRDFEQNSSESSYVEELGSVSSRESIKPETVKKHRGADGSTAEPNEASKRSVDETFEETVSTVDSDSCLEDRIRAIEEEEDANGNAESRKRDADEDNSINEASSSGPDGYANLIKAFTMEAAAASSRSRPPIKEEKKKRSGLRRLLPGIFSPKDNSRKEGKRDHQKDHQKERKKRDERHFSQHQQNGVYTRSPDTMNLNEDITRNVRLNDTSLNGSIIEERLNEIKQELFPEQGMTTSTPDHFLQNDRTFTRDPRAVASFMMVNSSLSSIAPDDNKWYDRSAIISGSPEARNFKREPRNDNEPKCISLERKHSLQESANQPRFLRNHGPSGRISAPPSERFLIRPRAVHPVDRPLPAIPQRIEISNYEYHREAQRLARDYLARREMANRTPDAYRLVSGNDNYVNDPNLYENGNHLVGKPEMNRNHSMDSGFHLTPVSAQTRMKNQKPAAPKYSPSSSQKSCDYADSNYTPNSSQKSEFSPGSSKSGEYYLNSPRDGSSRASPDECFAERRDQASFYHNRANQDGESSRSAPYPVSPKITVRTKDEGGVVYDAGPISPLREVRVDKPPPRQQQQAVQACGDVSYAAQKASPNIPMSSNLAKLRANVESTVSDAGRAPPPPPVSLEAPFNDGRSSRLLASPVLPLLLQFRDPQRDDKDQQQRPSPVKNLPRLASPSTIQRMASPLTILTQGAPPSPIPCGVASATASLSPGSARSAIAPRILMRSSNESPQEPRPRTATNQKTPLTSPSVCQSRSSSAPCASAAAASSSTSRRAQPNDQILIASPKREASIYESEIGNRARTMESGCPDSPVPMADSPSQVMIQRAQTSPARHDERGGRQPRVSPVASQHPASPSIDAQQRNIQRPEPIYSRRQTAAGPAFSPTTIQPEMAELRRPEEALQEVERRVQSPPGTRRVHPQRPDVIYVPRDESPMSAEKPEAAAVQRSLRKTQQNSIYGTKRRESPVEDAAGEHRQARAIYEQRSSEPIYPRQTSRQQLSPSKRQMMQHLEAFYWQQKAIDSQRKSVNSPPTQSPIAEAAKVDSPEVREAIYWQRLKKLDEEQQRKLFAENQSLSLSPVRRNHRLEDVAGERIYLRGGEKMENGVKSLIPVVGKPTSPSSSTMTTTMGQKCHQNQPVLVVRPQQAQSVIYDERDGETPPRQQDAPRSSSVERRSLSLPRKPPAAVDDDDVATRTTSGGKIHSPLIYEIRERMSETTEEGGGGKRVSGPAPIFKRGSLISNSSSSVEYGSMGTKRVSFSNQSSSPEVANWPTKRGMAPEPPTRKHRTEETPEPIYLQGHEVLYGNLGKCQSGEEETQRTAEYDAKPLPPPPPRGSSSWMLKRSSSMRDSSEPARAPKVEIQRAKVPANPRRWPGVSESESGSEAGEVRKILLHRRNEEEWNPGGKGRQSNDTGGSGRAEGEGGSNDLAGGRRGGGGVLGGGRSSGTSGSGGGGGAGGRSRDEPRRHTLSGDHQPSLHHQQFNTPQLHPLHPHHLPPPHGGQYGTPPNRHTTMDLEMGTKSRQRKSPLPRGYPPPSSTMLFDDDPGIMSEVETSSTGFRRGGKQRSSLPVVRTPSKTLERPLGQVFLQYRNETKRALLPNEITSIDTVKALFVRSFPKQLTMEYLDSPHVKVYIHDSNKNMFYELEDLRSHLRDIRDRSVLRLFESTDGVAGMPGPMGVAAVGGTGLPPHWEDQSYFSEPEFDSEFQHQHIHKSKTSKNSTSGSSYYMGGSSTLPRGGSLMRAYSPATSSVVAGPNATPAASKALGTPGGGGGVAPAKPLRSYQCGKSPLGGLGGSARFSRDSSVSLYSIPDRLHGESGYMSSPERGGAVSASSGRYPGGPYSTGSSYEEPYYSQYSGTVTPVIDEEASDTELLEESYNLYGVKPPGRPPSGPPRSPFPPGAPALPPGQPYDVTRIRVEHMERQLANLTGLVQKALTHAPHTSPSPRDYLQVPAGRDPYTRTTGAGDEFDKHSSSSSASLPDDSYLRTDVKPPKLGKDKSVSFEKSVSFSDEPPDMNSPKQHSPQHAADTKPTKPAIKSSTLPRMSSQERDRHKPTPPPKPVALAAGQYVYRDLALTPEMYNQLRGLQKKAKDLRQEVRNLRRMSQTQAHTVRETIRDSFITIRAMLLSGGEAAWAAGDTEKMRLGREEDLYKQEMMRLEKDLTELESTVEELRGNVINRKTRVNMSDVENMALILSKSSKTVADLKVRFPSLQEGMKGLLSSEMEKVVREEKFLKEEPERLESALRRCKKLTGTLVTLKRLASVQEQRSPNAASVDVEETPPITPTSAQHSKTTAPVPAERTVVGSAGVIGGGPHVIESSAPNQQRPENALDALLDELQTFSRPTSQMSQASGMTTTTTTTIPGGQSMNHVMPSLSELGRSASQIVHSRAPCISDIGRKGSIDSSTSLAITTPSQQQQQQHGSTNTLRRLHSYPSSSDTDTSPPIARLQTSDSGVVLPPSAPQKPPVPERNAELLQLATSRRVPPPPPPRTSSRSPLASPTSPQLPPRNPTAGTLRRGRTSLKESGKPPMALPSGATASNSDETLTPSTNNNNNNILSTSNSSSCESINSQEGLQNKKGRQEQLEQRHQELLRKQKALQEQYARLQQLHRNASGLTTVPPAPPDLLKKTGSESNLLAKMGLGLSTTTSGSLTSLATKLSVDGQQPVVQTTPSLASDQQHQHQHHHQHQHQHQQQQQQQQQQQMDSQTTQNVSQTTTSKIYETDIL